MQSRCPFVSECWSVGFRFAPWVLGLVHGFLVWLWFWRLGVGMLGFSYWCGCLVVVVVVVVVVVIVKICLDNGSNMQKLALLDWQQQVVYSCLHCFPNFNLTFDVELPDRACRGVEGCPVWGQLAALCLQMRLRHQSPPLLHAPHTDSEM